MSFGFGVSDFIKALELANEIRSRFVDAPDQFKAISDESVSPVITYRILTVYLARVKSLKIILEDVEIVLPQRDLTDDQDKVLRDIAGGCHNVLNTLKQQLEKYQELGPDPKGWDRKNLRFKVQRGWKRIRWDTKDAEELRSRLVSNISLLNAFYGAAYQVFVHSFTNALRG